MRTVSGLDAGRERCPDPAPRSRRVTLVAASRPRGARRCCRTGSASSGTRCGAGPGRRHDLRQRAACARRVGGPAELTRLEAPGAGQSCSASGFGARYDARQKQVHRETTVLAAALGTSPWGMVRWLRDHAPGAGPHRVRLVDDTLRGRTSSRRSTTSDAALAAGRPVPLLVGVVRPAALRPRAAARRARAGGSTSRPAARCGWWTCATWCATGGWRRCSASTACTRSCSRRDLHGTTVSCARLVDSGV